MCMQDMEATHREGANQDSPKTPRSQMLVPPVVPPPLRRHVCDEAPISSALLRSQHNNSTRVDLDAILFKPDSTPTLDPVPSMDQDARLFFNDIMPGSALVKTGDWLKAVSAISGTKILIMDSSMRMMRLRICSCYGSVNDSSI